MDHPELVDYYSRRAPEYERIYHKPERQEDLRALEALVLRDLAGLDVLEVACGTGWWTERIARVARSILATDAGEEVLAIARAKSLPAQRARFEIADAFAPHAIAGSFHAAFAGFFWSHVGRERLAGWLVALHRRLGAGARVVAVDNRYVAGSSTPVARTDAAGNAYQVRALADGTEHEVLKNFWTEEELRAAVSGIAADIEFTGLTYYWRMSYRVGGLG
jgi:demethylmenaquinone methyltransferase/2-methoxy-6-polyprenyl-1,4-benzoquinol methylase